MSVVIFQAGRAMRVTTEAKAATRRQILDAATTRDIADAAGIASGTLFNYFATKEAVLASLAAEAAAAASDEFEARARDAQSLEEDLFAFVAAGLRKLRPLRKHLAALLDTALSPLAATRVDEAQSLRVSHLETVARLARRHRGGELSPVALQLYWTLYAGLLAFWANDRSPRQEDTLALLDQSLAMFVGWLGREANPATPKGETES